MHLEVFDHLPTGLCIISDKNQILFITEKMKDYFKVRQTQEILKRFQDIVVQSNHVSLEQIVSSDQFKTLEDRFLSDKDRKDNERHIAEELCLKEE